MRFLLISIPALLIQFRPAFADPCEAIPEHGPMPSYLGVGDTFSGAVAYVIDGDSLCVAVGAGPQNWVEVRLADFNAPESSEPRGPAAKAALARIAMGRTALCTASFRSYDRIAATCLIGGHSIDRLQRPHGARYQRIDLLFRNDRKLSANREAPPFKVAK